MSAFSEPSQVPTIIAHKEPSVNPYILFQSIHPMITRAKFGIYEPKTYLTITQDIEPSSVKIVLLDQRWYMAIKQEFDALHRNQTWTLVPFDSATKIVGNKWIF